MASDSERDGISPRSLPPLAGKRPDKYVVDDLLPDPHLAGVDPANSKPSNLSKIKAPSPHTTGFRDYDDFLREVAGDDWLSCRFIAGSPTIYVINKMSGHEYALTAAQAQQEGIYPSLIGKVFSRNSLSNEIRGIVPTASMPATTTHIFDEGRVLCGFFKGRLVDWPKGHDQMSLQAYRLQRGGANCFQCTQKAAELEL